MSVPPTSIEFPAVDKTVSEPPPGNRGGAAPADARPPALLHVLTREGEVFERELDGDEVKVGKGTDNDLILADPAVSARHAVIRADGGGYAIADLGSRNGTFVNDAPVTEPRRLGHGDVIKIGRSTLTFRLAQANETMIIARAEAAIKTPNPQPPPPLTEEALAAAVLAARLASTADVGRLRGPEASGRRLALALVEEKLVSEATLRDLMSRTFHLPTADLRGAEIDPAIAAKLSPQKMREDHIIPVAVKPDHLTLAVADPTDTAVIERVKAAFGLPVIVELASPGDIAAQIERTFAPRLIGLLPSGEKMEALVDQPEIGIGTATHNRVVVSHPTVSRTHAVILARDGGYSIVDLGSSNGTFVNGEQMGHSARTLQHGDKIQVGQVMLTFRNPTETTENKTARLSPE
ncbi:MAG TPA: FHA domain-containing protein, partial [Blastocatellia bacterium]|nr:FHA domain-containing protein [Blastocatellia bacterium]